MADASYSHRLGGFGITAVESNKFKYNIRSTRHKVGLPVNLEQADPVDPVQMRLVTTSMLPCVALEYGQMPCAAASNSRATSASIPGTLTLRRARRK